MFDLYKGVNSNGKMIFPNVDMKGVSPKDQISLIGSCGIFRI